MAQICIRCDELRIPFTTKRNFIEADTYRAAIQWSISMVSPDDVKKNS